MRYAIAGAIFVLLPLDAFAAPGAVPRDAVVISATPTGQGDPNAWTCRKPMDIGGTGMHVRRLGPEVCQTNQVWADLIKNHETVDAKGAVVPASNSGIGSWGNVGEYFRREEKSYFEAHR